MSSPIVLNEISHSYGSKNLFSKLNVSFQVGEKIGLIGQNGTGKSTLLKIINQEIIPDAGGIARDRTLTSYYVAQSPILPGNQTIKEFLYGRLESEAIQTGLWEKYNKANGVLSGLELSDEFPQRLSQKICDLSGGWHKKVALADAILRTPDILILDEPTNHLDLSSILWLESYLKDARSTLVIVSHDRTFIDRVCDRFIELDQRYENGALSFKGNLSEFLIQKENYLEALRSRSESLANSLRREMEWLRRGAKARTTKQKARIDRALELKDDVSHLKNLLTNKEVELSFDTRSSQAKKLIEAKQISKSFNDVTLFKNLDLLITRNTRIGILGNNGIGKSTLIKILLGEETPDSGTVFSHSQLSVNFFRQNRDDLNPDESILKNLCPYGETVEYQNSKIHVYSYLDKFNFPSAIALQPVRSLSGGEQARLQIAKLMLNPADVLVLDEPTNDLDFQTLDILRSQLEDYPGALILISHDRDFLDHVCDEVLYLPDQIKFSGTAQWESWFLNQKKELLKNKSTIKMKTEVKPIVKAGRLGFKEQRELENIESVIQRKEEDLEHLKLKMSDPQTLSNHTLLTETATLLASAETELAQLYDRWSYLDSLK